MNQIVNKSNSIIDVKENHAKMIFYDQVRRQKEKEHKQKTTHNNENIVQSMNTGVRITGALNGFSAEKDEEQDESLTDYMNKRRKKSGTKASGSKTENRFLIWDAKQRKSLYYNKDL